METKTGNSSKILIRVPANKLPNANHHLPVVQSPQQVVNHSQIVVQNIIHTSPRNVVIQNTPLLLVADQRKLVGKTPALKPVVCRNCGATFNEAYKFKCCSKSSFNKVETAVGNHKPQAVTKTHLGGCSTAPALVAHAKPSPVTSRPRLNASSFYGNTNGASEYCKFLAAQGKSPNLMTGKRSSRAILNNSACKPAEPITISDSSDEADADPEVKKRRLEIPASPVAPESSKKDLDVQKAISKSSSLNGSTTPCKKLRQSPETKELSVLSRIKTLPETNLFQPATNKDVNAWKTATLNVPLKSVRVGQFHHKDQVLSRWSGVNISMTFLNHILNIPWYAITKMELAPRQDYVFVTVAKDFLPVIRHQLAMVSGKVPYFDPGGLDDQMYIVFYISPSWVIENKNRVEQKLLFLRKKLNKPQAFMSYLSATEANNRQCRIADAELLNSCCQTKSQNIVVHSQNQLTPTNCRTTSVELVVPTTPSVSTPNQQVYAISMNPEQKLIRLTRSTRSQLHPVVSCASPAPVEVRPVFNEQHKQLAIYPPPPAKGGISITNEDQFCLNPGEFLNDVIIDFYLKYVMMEVLNETDRQRSHVFSCFFYKRLTQNPPRNARFSEDKTLSPGKRRHGRVKKWTRGVDLFSKDFVFIPINEASHWFLAVICFPGQDGKYFVDPKTGKQVTEDQLPPLQIPQSSGRKVTCSTEIPPPVTLNGDSVGVDTLKQPQVELTRLSSDSLPGNHVDLAEVSDSLNEDEGECPTEVADEVEVTSASRDEEENNSAVTEAVNRDADVKPESPKTAPTDDDAPSATPTSPMTSDGGMDAFQYREPCILIFDSLRGPSRSKTSTTLREYLNHEWKTRKEPNCGERIFDKTTMKMSSPQVPQQDNYSDCGVFLLQYVEKMFQTPITNYAIPIKSLGNWFDPAECKEKRNAIKNIIDRLHKEQGQDDT